MATFKLYPNGMTMGRGNAHPVGGKRGVVEGWSAAAVRRHKAWLYSVQGPLLTGVGEAVTLTLRDTPPTSDEWRAALQRFFDRLRLLPGFERAHWVVEWQRRGTPHLHLAVYGQASIAPGVVSAWLAVMGGWGPLPNAQFVTPITGAVGWLQYLSKHASRGVAHYQRQGKPPGWTTTGRLWGKLGEWPTAEPMVGSLTQEEFVWVRRQIRAYAVAEARSRALAARSACYIGHNAPRDVERAAWRGVVRLRRMFQVMDREHRGVGHQRALSASRGISEWVPEAVALDLLTGLDLAPPYVGRLALERPGRTPRHPWP
jgi:hypothetical protein